MSIEIDILSGDAAWRLAKPLYQAIWPPQVAAKLPWAGIVSAHADLRVLVQNETGDVVSHVGIYRREVTWDGHKRRVGGIGGVLTRQDVRRRGYATIALEAALRTLKDEGATDFALLFCEPRHAAFYAARGWKPFDGEIWAEQPQGRIRFDVTAPYVHDVRRAPLSGTIDLCGLPW